MCSLFVVFVFGCLYNLVAIVWNPNFPVYRRGSFFYHLPTWHITVLNFTLSKLWSVILQLLQNRPHLRSFSNFLESIPATLKKDLFGTVVNEKLDQKYLSFHPPVPPGSFQKMNIFIFSYFLSYSIVLCYTKRFEIMTGATLMRILGSPMPKQSDDSCIQEN